MKVLVPGILLPPGHVLLRHQIVMLLGHSLLLSIMYCCAFCMISLTWMRAVLTLALLEVVERTHAHGPHDGRGQ